MLMLHRSTANERLFLLLAYIICLHRLHVVFAVSIFNLYFEYALVGSNCCFIDSFVDKTISGMFFQLRKMFLLFYDISSLSSIETV